jgi:hypothetical protein
LNLHENIDKVMEVWGQTDPPFLMAGRRAFPSDFEAQGMNGAVN